MRLLAPLPLALLAFSCYAQDGTRAGSALLVHVNQVALERTGPKAAIVEYAGAGSAGTFKVLKDGAAIQTGALEPLPTFTEWSAGKKYFKADFSALATNGNYRIEATVGDAQARSPAFAVADNATFADDCRRGARLLPGEPSHQARRQADPRVRHAALCRRLGRMEGRWRRQRQVSVAPVVRELLQPTTDRDGRVDAGRVARQRPAALSQGRARNSCRRGSAVGRRLPAPPAGPRRLLLHDGLRPLGLARRGAHGRGLRRHRRRLHQGLPGCVPRRRRCCHRGIGARIAAEQGDGHQRPVLCCSVSAGCRTRIRTPAGEQSQVRRQRCGEHHRRLHRAARCGGAVSRVRRRTLISRQRGSARSNLNQRTDQRTAGFAATRAHVPTITRRRPDSRS